MAKINIQPDCGNAPRKNFLKDLNIAWVNGDQKFFETNLSDSIKWVIVGQSAISGKEKFLKALATHKLWKPREVTIDTIITHGRDAAVSGRITASDKSMYSFCDVFRFKGAAGTVIDEIKTFIIRGE
jgi:hypothetical protein